MPKLPESTVKFDSPLRRTSRAPEAPAALAGEESPVAAVEAPAIDRETPVIALPRPSRSETPEEATEQGGLEHRITVRVDDDIKRALELERHERAMAGEKKANIADVARKVLATWAKRRLARDRS